MEDNWAFSGRSVKACIAKGLNFNQRELILFSQQEEHWRIEDLPVEQPESDDDIEYKEVIGAFIGRVRSFAFLVTQSSEQISCTTKVIDS